MSRLNLSSFPKFRMSPLVAALILGSLGPAAVAANFGTGNIVVVRVGDGTGINNITAGTGAQLYLDEFSGVDDSAVKSVTLTGLIATGSQGYDTSMTRSENRHFLIIPAFLGAIGDATTNVAFRTIAVVDASGAIAASPKLATGSYFRGATSPDGLNLYAVNGSGVFYATSTAVDNTAPLSLGNKNNRTIVSAFGNLYVGNDSSTLSRPYQFGAGYPTSGTPAVTALAGMPAVGSSFTYGFGMCHSNGAFAPTPDTIYMASNGGVSKWCFDSGQAKWIQFGLVGGTNFTTVQTWSVAVSKPTASSPATIYFTAGGTGQGTAAIVANEVWKIVDSTGFQADFTASPLTKVATAPTGSRFTGVAFTPDTPTLVDVLTWNAAVNGSDVSLTWSSASETDAVGFNIWRSETRNGQYTKLNSAIIPAVGTAYHGATYAYHDLMDPAKTYYYKLEDIDTRGTSTYQEPIAVKATGTFAPTPVTSPAHPTAPRINRTQILF